MVYHLFQYLSDHFDFAGERLFNYVSFRAALGVIISLIISVLFGQSIIKKLQRLQISDEQRQLGLAGENLKAGTPTMGGLIIILATIVPTLLLANLENVYILLMLGSVIWLGIIGFADDYIKVFKKDKAGLKSIFKIIGQVMLGLIVGVTMLQNQGVVVRMLPETAKANGYEIVKTYPDTTIINGRDTVITLWARAKAPITTVPFIKNNELDYSRILWFLGDNARDLVWIFFIVMAIFVITAVSNGANLTDGLDGLCAGTSAVVISALAAMAYVSGNSEAAQYLNVMFIPGSSELVIFSACLLGGCIGFLWYNVFPARVFMGDTGSLMLGGIIAALAIVLRKELMIPVLCGVFLVENLSVMLQVWWFKRTKRKYGEGRRIFLMSPLHHHYQKKGLHEATITARFWIVQIMLAVVTVLTLKIR